MQLTERNYDRPTETISIYNRTNEKHEKTSKNTTSTVQVILQLKLKLWLAALHNVLVIILLVIVAVFRNVSVKYAGHKVRVR